jgi:hypothetical protein
VAAQKIKWQREAGRTQQDQVAAAGGDAQGLIADVYRRQGTSAQVRSAIEQDCVAEQARNAQAVALLAAAGKTPGANGSAAAAGDGHANGGAAAAPDGAPAAREPAGPTAADLKKATCQPLDEQLADVRSRQRAGGTVQAMEALRQQDATLTGKRRAAGC